MMEYSEYIQLRKDIYQNACEKGLYGHNPTAHELHMRVLAELAEAFEIWKEGFPIYLIPRADPPQGIPFELADVMIMIWSAEEHLRGDYRAKSLSPFNFSLKHDCAAIICEEQSFGHDLGVISEHITKLLSGNGTYHDLAFCEALIFKLAEHHAIDLWERIKEKHEYNKTREYRHGEQE